MEIAAPGPFYEVDVFGYRPRTPVIRVFQQNRPEAVVDECAEKQSSDNLALVMRRQVSIGGGRWGTASAISVWPVVSYY
jgi:hypothetical protein